MAGKKAALKQVEEVNQIHEDDQNELVISNDPSNELDALFSELEAGLAADGVVVNGLPQEPVSEVQLLAAGTAVSNDELKAQAMVELDALSSPSPDNSQTPAPKEKAKRFSTVGMAKSEVLAHLAGTRLDELLNIRISDAKLPEEEQFDNRLHLLEIIDKLPKKIGEKTTNLFSHLTRGVQVSNYTRIALNFLLVNGSMTSKELKDAYLSRPYSEGTSSSQCTQLMTLLPVLGIAIKQGNKLTVNPDSSLFPLLTNLSKPAVADEDVA